MKKKVDKFEQLKAGIVHKISTTKQIISSDGFKTNSEMKHSVRKTIQSILSEVKQLENLNVSAAQKQGAWLTFSKRISPEALEIRKKDVIKLKEHYRQLTNLSIGKKTRNYRI